MNKKVYIMSGVSGSGKSTYIQKEIVSKLQHNATFLVVSADDYFLTSEGKYEFDASKLSLAHATCFRQFIEALYDEQRDCTTEDVVVVDNTNTTAEEIAPYILGASAFGFDAEIITLRIPVLFACERNKHGVSPQAAEAQHNRLNARKLPPWWKNTDVTAGGWEYR